MELSVSISKTWQEKQYEPFNIQLGMKFEVPDNTSTDKQAEVMCSEAANLQAIADSIYGRRQSGRQR